MNKNNKDKIRLLILGIIIIGFGYYKYVYLPQLTIIEEKTKQESELKEKFNSNMKIINLMEERKSDVKILQAKISGKSISFYPAISEEHIILELDQLLKDSNLKGGMTFQPIVSDSIEDSKSDVKSLGESSLKGIVDKYNNIFQINVKTDQSKDKNENDSKNVEVNNSGTSNANVMSNSNSSNTSSKINSKDKNKNTVQYLKCELKVEGSYSSLDKLLNTIGNNEKKIVVNSIKISEDTSNSIKGTINLEFYSIPKINNELENYLKWKLNNEYGKNLLFSNTLSSGNVVLNKDTSDFIASIKSVSSDLLTVMFGKANDLFRTTYVYADNNSEEIVEIILNQDKDKYYYIYKTSKGMYPANNSAAGAEFVPVSKNINLNVLSENKMGSNDKAELKLKIINKTDKLVNVNIAGDDKADPRVTVDGNGNNISVNQK
jgi:type IV pilus assembly protein PilO